MTGRPGRPPQPRFTTTITLTIEYGAADPTARAADLAAALWPYLERAVRARRELGSPVLRRIDVNPTTTSRSTP